MRKEINRQTAFASAEYKLGTATSLIIQLCMIMLSAMVWICAGLFGLYILAFYDATLLNGNMENWNAVLPGLYLNKRLYQRLALACILQQGPLSCFLAVFK